MGSPERKQRQRSHVLHMLFLLALAIMVITLPLGVLPKLHGMQAHVGQPQFTSTHLDSAAAAAAGWLSSHEPEWPSLKTQGWPLQYHSGPTRTYSFAPGAPFAAHQYSTLQDLLWAHKAWQDQALLDATAKQQELGSNATAKEPWPKVLRVDLQEVGVGNRLPSIVTGLLMAALSGRIFMLSPDPHFQALMNLTHDADWGRYSALYSNVTACEAFYNRFMGPLEEWCREGEPVDPVVFWYSSSDYDVPLLQISPTIKGILKKLLPSGEFFHEVAIYLFRPSEAVYTALQPYKTYSDQCVVGLHIRTGKPFPDDPSNYTNLVQFARVTRLVARAQPGSVFVASDADNFKQVAAMLPGRHVWWTQETHSTLANYNAAGYNPGSDLSALVDLFLLARCKHIILTAGSSFATMAAGIANVRPIHVVRGQHEKPFYNPWYWAALTSEPCMWKAGVYPSWMSNEIREALRTQFDGWLHHEQCS